jgi:anti-anti-sigma factor
MITITGMATVAYVTLAGEIDRADAVEIGSAVTEFVEVGVTDLTVDLSRITSVDTTGLEALVVADRALEAAGGRMVLVGAPVAARRVFEIARLHRAYHIIPPGLGRRSPPRRSRTSPKANHARRPTHAPAEPDGPRGRR